jgi:hypothetical protein
VPRVSGDLAMISCEVEDFIEQSGGAAIIEDLETTLHAPTAFLRSIHPSAQERCFQKVGSMHGSEGVLWKPRGYIRL